MFGRKSANPSPQLDKSGLSKRDKWALRFAGIQDAGAALGGRAGGNYDSTYDRMVAAQKAQADASYGEQLSGMFGPSPPAAMQGPGMDGAPMGRPQAAGMPSLQDPKVMAIIADGVRRGDPRALQMMQVMKASQPERGQPIEGPDGIYERGDGGWSRVQAYPEQRRDAPAGFQWVGDKLQLIPGYAEGVGQISGTRRDAITSRPMPRVGGGGRVPKRGVSEMSNAELMAIAKGGR